MAERMGFPGHHRTGTVGDGAGADWLAREASRLGATPATEEFVLDRLDPSDAYLEFADARIPGVPLFDAPATTADGISGTLGAIGSSAAIAVAELSPVSVHTEDYEEVRRNAPYRGLVILCKGAHPGLGLLNAERFRQPYGAPAIQLSSEARDAVLAAAAKQAPARLVATSRRAPSRARNVTVTISGNDPHQTAGRRHDAAQLVVAIDCRTRRGACLLARIAARSARLAAALQRDLHRQQRPRARSPRSRRIHGPPSWLGATNRGRR